MSRDLTEWIVGCLIVGLCVPWLISRVTVAAIKANRRGGKEHTRER